MMNLREFDNFIGGGSYVRCIGKKSIDTSTCDLKEAQEWLDRGNQIGWWLRSGYIVVDIDEGKKEALECIKRTKLRTFMCKTGKGIHLYFKTDKEYPQNIRMLLPIGLKCDFRCAGKGYVLLPYNTIDGRAFNKIKDIVPMPIEWTPLLGRKSKESLLGMKEGDGRNTNLFNHLMAFKHRGAKKNHIISIANVINDVVFDSPMSEKELDAIIQHTKKYKTEKGSGNNPYIIYNSNGAASKVNARAINDYFVNQGGIFIKGYDAYKYHNGVYQEATLRLKTDIKEMINEDSLISAGRINETYKLVAEDIRLHKENINADTDIINFKNTMYRISTTEKFEHDSTYLSTIQIPHELTEIKKPIRETRLLKFLKLTKIPKEDIEMLLSYIAYCMTLSYGLKTFLVLLGKSNTGKSVLIRFIENLVGYTNTSSLSMHELNMRFYPSQLYNKLINTCADNSSLPLSSIENLKKITGGDQIMHEKKGQEPFFFVSFAKLIFSFNQLPLQLEEKSNAFYKRMRILVMNEELYLNDIYVEKLCSPESMEEIIPHLVTYLPLDEIPQTARSLEQIELLRCDSDTIHSFISSECDTTNKDAITMKKDFFDGYRDWCFINQRKPHGKYVVLRYMRTLCEEIRHPYNGEACWRGIKLLKKGGK